MALNISYQNVRGLRSKATEFFLSTTSCTSDIIAISETWFDSSCINAMYFPPRFSVERTDRDCTAVGRSRGGGVALALSNHLKYVRRKDLEGSVECVWVEVIKSHNKSIFIGCVYFPDHLHISSVNNFFESLSYLIPPTSTIYLLGDFNVPHVNWDNLTYLGNRSDKKDRALALFNISQTLNLSQFNCTPNSNNRFLDLVFSNHDGVEVSRNLDYLVKEDSYHPSLLIRVPLSQCLREATSVNTTRRNYAAGDYVGLTAALSSTDWSDIHSNSDVNQCVEIFTSRLQYLLDTFIPSFTTKQSRFPKWYSSSLRFLIKKKNYHNRKFNHTGLQFHRNLFRIFRKLSKSQFHIDYLLHKSRIENSFKSNTNCFWNHVNNLRGVNNESPKLSVNNSLESDPSVLVNVFADHFLSVFIKSSSYNPLSLSVFPSTNFIQLPRITLSDVNSAISLLKPSKSSGNDNIPAFFVKACAFVISPVLEYIFNKSLDSNVFPSLWNSALIVPIYKSGVRSSVCNYRPISLCNVFCKVFERIIHSFLAPQIDPLLSPRQHGFRPSRSTCTNLVSFVSHVGCSISKGSQVDAIYFDFVKAFDRVDHGILLSKLCTLNLAPSLFLWFQSYLSSRTCAVRLGLFSSPYYSASSGVHQGSILGPLLFNIYVNDLGKSLHSCAFEFYADDLKISLDINNISSCHQLQASIDQVCQWCSLNNMEIHAGKSQVISFCRTSSPLSFPYSSNGVLLPRVSSVRDLGVILDSKLRFDGQLDAMISKANQRLSLIRRIAHDLSLNCFLLLYKSIVRPVLEYVPPVWNVFGLTKSNSIENIQRRFVRTCYLKYMYRRVFYGYDSLCDRLCLEPLYKRRKAYEVLFLVNCLSGKTVCSLVQDQVVVLPPGRRAGRPLYIKEIADSCPLVRCVSSINALVCCPNYLCLSKIRSTCPFIK